MPIDKDLFNPQSLCSIAGHMHGMVMRGRREERRQDGDEREKRGDKMVTRGRREGEET